MASVAAPVKNPNIIDIRSDVSSVSLKEEIIKGLKAGGYGEKTLPTLLLYDVRGLKLFEQITYLEEYYLTGEEIGVLEKHADGIAKEIPENAMVVELGSGNLRKIKLLLDALDKTGKNVEYYALDLMESELERTLSELPSFGHVVCSGLLGTYEDGFAWLSKQEQVNRPKVVLSMGSSIGNFTRDEAAGFIKQIAAVLGRQDAVLVGVDACQDVTRVFKAYNDSQGITRQFTLNGLVHANKLLGYEAFDMCKWDAIGEYDEAGGRHRAYVVPTTDVVVEGVTIRKGERVRIEESYKYSQAQANHLWRASGAREVAKFSNDDGTYAIHLLKTEPFTMFSTKPENYAAHPVPSWDDFKQVWAIWDRVTRQMIPEEQLLDKPIKLRNACVFYLGHLPTFFDIKLTEATGTAPTEPSYFYNIFERGIDPDVDNPEHCHAHSEIPDAWPELDTILDFQRHVRERVQRLYESRQAHKDAWTGRALWLGFEHDLMHLETLLYMLVQSEWVRPPSNVPTPDFQQMAKQARERAVDNQWFNIPEQTITIGMDDPDTPDGPVRYFGWDVEKPLRSVKVGAFKAKARPITNEEYSRFMLATGKMELPASWTTLPLRDDTNGTNGVVAGDASLYAFMRGKAVRSVYGLVPLEYALDWPVSASYDELARCAKYMGGRIPTMEEAHSIYEYAEVINKKEAAKALGHTIPAVNGHLSNNGVEETPPSYHSMNGSNAAASLDPNKLFVNLDEANVGFKHWHPVPVTPNGSKLGGQAGMGGLWEWTSSVLEKQEGFVPMKLYPAYSDDFYDNKHNVVLGGSWATHPRLAGRKSFVNWYQRNYPYVWAGARLVKDA